VNPVKTNDHKMNLATPIQHKAGLGNEVKIKDTCPVHIFVLLGSLVVYKGLM
jgi:hypothetical protein